jgi:hypothetical protein
MLGAMTAASAATAVAAAAPSAATAVAAALPTDPIYASIERHKAVMLPYNIAVAVRAAYDETDEEEDEEEDRMDAAVDEAWNDCEQAAVDLIKTSPTSLAGAVTAIEYLREQLKAGGAYMPQDLIDDSPGDVRDTIGWVDAFLETIVDAVIVLADGGKATAPSEL